MTIADEEKPGVTGDVKPGESEHDNETDAGMFSQENVASDTEVPQEDVDDAGIEIGKKPKSVVITASDKASFIDSVVNNTRFERDYSLFGGKLNVRIRSVTAEEANALAAWSFRKSVSDPTWHLSGRGRGCILAAQVAMFNGVEVPPLEKPLFETLESDGKTLKEPGWVSSVEFWASKGTAVVDAVINCIKDFDSRYKVLCEKAEDENFWLPDTP